MTGRTFTLAPFPGSAFPEGMRITGAVIRRGGELDLRLEMKGPLDRIVLTEPAPAPERRVGLWETTCFEFFLTRPGDRGYWEVNLSPGGHWNIFRFDDYRQGMQPEAAFKAIPFTSRSTPGHWQLDLSLDLSSLGIEGAAWGMAVSTVIAERTGGLSYWALAHPAPQPDFHHRDAFVLEMPGD
jgi:hypothetical protein